MKIKNNKTKGRKNKIKTTGISELQTKQYLSFQVIWVLREKPKCIVEITELLGISHEEGSIQLLTETLDELEKRELIKLMKQSGKKVQKKYSLTEKGSSTIEEIKDAFTLGFINLIESTKPSKYGSKGKIEKISKRKTMRK